MDMPYWKKQTNESPLYPALLWSRPENRQLAGKLLIIGGNQYGFAAAGEAYGMAQRAGIGISRVLLPDALHRVVGRTLEAGEFAPSTPSGSFSQKALGDFMLQSNWADGVLLAGDLGRNSETAILLEKFLETWQGQLVVTKDAVDYLIPVSQALLHRENTTLVITMAQLQKLARSARFLQPFLFQMDLIRLIEALHNFTTTYPLRIVVKHHRTLAVASNGDVSTSLLIEDIDIWRVRTAAYASVWLIQNPAQPFAALTTAVHQLLA